MWRHLDSIYTNLFEKAKRIICDIITILETGFLILYFAKKLNLLKKPGFLKSESSCVEKTSGADYCIIPRRRFT
jgi:hypothetical protein